MPEMTLNLLSWYKEEGEGSGITLSLPQYIYQWDLFCNHGYVFLREPTAITAILWKCSSISLTEIYLIITIIWTGLGCSLPLCVWWHWSWLIISPLPSWDVALYISSLAFPSWDSHIHWAPIVAAVPTPPQHSAPSLHPAPSLRAPAPVLSESSFSRLFENYNSFAIAMSFTSALSYCITEWWGFSHEVVSDSFLTHGV